MQAIGDRLVALRREMAEAGYDALLVPRADEYLAEYPPRHNERLRWVSGFTGSAGMAVVLADRAALFVDGRYTVQVREQAPAALFEYHHLIEEPPLAWLVEVLAAGATVACDARTHSFEWYRRAERVLDEAGISLAATPDNLVDRCWTDRPAPLVEAAILLEEAYAGESSLARRQRIAEGIAAQGADAALVYAPESLSWLLNIRGSDVPNMPVVQGMGMLESNGDVTLMVHPERVPEGLAAHVGAGLTVVAEERAAAVLADYKGRTVLADPATANAGG
jgi:Xaa-Pro aminopeptidase